MTRAALLELATSVLDTRGQSYGPADIRVRGHRCSLVDHAGTPGDSGRSRVVHDRPEARTSHS